LEIEFRSLNEESVQLRICDDGVGLPKGVDIATSESLGLQIVAMLSQQIKGTLELDAKNGTSVTIVFPNREE
jgi:two-component sensor histidine kinase